uniref:NAD-specific glutamate dehydrogenase n=1 Tax=Strombidium inclinatum TaxID=197538 RepID=A0A7S3IZJ3_9SPIT|mmetsp:Transcript_5876/g.9503  ORF Transcript_5876/g.9503 Transcript_5876/m.9503 type:complete len:534 (+) Transcript_5876:693-2294(+)
MNLFVQLHTLLADNVKLGDLVVDDGLALFQGDVDLLDLVLDFTDLALRVEDHLIAVLDLSVQVVGQLLLLRLLEVFLEQLLSLLEQLSLLLTDDGHGSEKVLNLLKVTLGLLVPQIPVGDVDLQLGAPRHVGRLQLVLELNPLLFNVRKLPSEVFDLLVIFLGAHLAVSIVKLTELRALELDLFLLASQLHLDLLGLDLDGLGVVGLLLDLLVEGSRHVLQLLGQHVDAFFRSLSLHREGLVTVAHLVVTGLLSQIPLGQVGQSLLKLEFLLLHALSLRLLLFQKGFGFLGLQAGGFAVTVELTKALQTLFRLAVEVALQLVELSVLGNDGVHSLLVLLEIAVAALLDGGLEARVLGLDLLFLLQVRLDEFLHLTDLALEVIEFNLVVIAEFPHLFVRVVLDRLRLGQALLGQSVILVQVLAHVLELVQVAELAFFVVHDDLLLLLDALDDALHLVVEVDVHALDVIAFGLLAQKLHELFLFLLDVHGLRALRTGARRVWPKAEEVSKDIRYLVLLFVPPVLEPLIHRPGRGS